jgi:hypothetical protein
MSTDVRSIQFIQIIYEQWNLTIPNKEKIYCIFNLTEMKIMTD